MSIHYKMALQPKEIKKSILNCTECPIVRIISSRFFPNNGARKQYCHHRKNHCIQQINLISHHVYIIISLFKWLSFIYWFYSYLQKLKYSLYPVIFISRKKWRDIETWYLNFKEKFFKNFVNHKNIFYLVFMFNPN